VHDLFDDWVWGLGGFPASGAAYSYISAVFGEFLAWIIVASLILEHILANAAVIRGFSP
jgi:amino acid transporter